MKIERGTALLLTGALTLSAAVAIGATLFSPDTTSHATQKPDSAAVSLMKASMNSPEAADKLLTITATGLKNCRNNITLNASTLLSLPQQKFRTSHTWSENIEEFSGPLLKDVLALACKNASHLMLTAINDYSIEMDFNKLQHYRPIIALSVNGKRLSVRNKGPLWVMIPLDQFDEPPRSLDDMLIWQLSDIKILNADHAI